jgi:hypothetical protein
MVPISLVTALTLMYFYISIIIISVKSISSSNRSSRYSKIISYVSV